MNGELSDEFLFLPTLAGKAFTNLVIGISDAVMAR